MSTSNEKALRLALEALERVNNVDDDCDILSPELANFVVDTIDALKEALAVKKEQSVSLGEPLCCNGNCPNTKDCEQAMQCLYTTPYVPTGRQQRKPLTDEQMWNMWNSQGSDEMNQQEAIAFARAIEAALGIAQQQRTWVGLTDDEIKEIHRLSFGKDIAVATGLTEAKLKEKNTRNGGCL